MSKYVCVCVCVLLNIFLQDACSEGGKKSSPFLFT